MANDLNRPRRYRGRHRRNKLPPELGLRCLYYVLWSVSMASCLAHLAAIGRTIKLHPQMEGALQKVFLAVLVIGALVSFGAILAPSKIKKRGQTLTQRRVRHISTWLVGIAALAVIASMIQLKHNLLQL